METKITLDKFTENDFQLYYQLVNDEKVMEMITGRAIELQDAQIKFKKILDRNAAYKDFGSFKIMDPITNDFLGFAKLELIKGTQYETELGYMVLPQYWGKQIAGVAAKQLIKIAFDHQEIKRIIAVIDPKNLASRKILMNNNFTFIGYQDYDGLPGELHELIIHF